jgi:hypothetical protein
MAISASCFLKYMWYTAYYSAWYGHPRFAHQAEIASFRASLYFWIVIALEVACLVIICSLIRLRYTDLSRFAQYAIRLTASAAITVAGTALLVFALSWTQLGIG